MLREKAFDFWKTYIGLMTKGGVDVSMTNPAVTFTADAKAGEYDDISDEEYYELLDFTEELARKTGKRQPGRFSLKHWSIQI